MMKLTAASRRRPLFLISLLLVALCRGAASDPGGYDVRAFGARGDGVTVDGPAIEKAVAAASAAGGDTRRRVAGAGGQYDPPEENAAAGKYQDLGHTHWHNSLIWGENLENVSVLGPDPQ